VADENESSTIADMEQYMNWGMLIVALIGIIGSLWVVVASFRYLSARYGTGRALFSRAYSAAACGGADLRVPVLGKADD
jgi:hypothetical protein